jgi:hypothetical protein
LILKAALNNHAKIYLALTFSALKCPENRCFYGSAVHAYTQKYVLHSMYYGLYSYISSPEYIFRDGEILLNHYGGGGNMEDDGIVRMHCADFFSFLGAFSMITKKLLSALATTGAVAALALGAQGSQGAITGVISSNVEGFFLLRRSI